MGITEALLTAPRTIELRERDIPRLTGTQVLVQVRACGLCSTEIPVWLGQTQGKPGASHRYWKYPSSLGHEVSGVVMDVGPEVIQFKGGEFVTGIAYSGSGFSTYVVEDEKFWLKIPDGFKPEEVLGEPLACIRNIYRQMWKGTAKNFLIVGDGFMSIMLAKMCTSLGAWLLGCTVCVVGHHDSRLKRMPEKFACINSKALCSHAYLEARIFIDKDISTPWMNGYDCALDFTGTMAGLQLAASLCKPKNRTPLLMCGVYGEEPFSLGHYMVNRGVVPIPCYPAQSDDFPRDLRNGVTPETIRQSSQLITHTYRLEELDKAFEDAMGRRDNYMKGAVLI